MLLRLEPVDLATVTERQVQAFSARFLDKGVELRQSLRPALVAGDPGRLGQVIANLLSNALRYTDAGGTVVVSVRSNEHEALLEVSDTGIGILPENLSKVFTRFWRSERSRSRATGGAGIGLAIVKELVEAHAGRVEVRSEPEQGSTFTVRIPRVAAAR